MPSVVLAEVAEELGADLTIGIWCADDPNYDPPHFLADRIVTGRETAVALGRPLIVYFDRASGVDPAYIPLLTADDQVALYRLEKWRFSLRYYLERPLGRLQEPDDVRKFLTDKGGYILMLDEDYARLLNDGINLRSVAERRAVTGTTGTGLRKQKWGALVVATSDDTPRR